MSVAALRRGDEPFSFVHPARDHSIEQLREHGILPQVHYVPVHRHPDHAPFVAGQAFPGADAYYAGCLSLPMYPSLTDADVDRVVAALVAVTGG